MRLVQKNGHWIVALLGAVSLAYSAGLMRDRLPLPSLACYFSIPVDSNPLLLLLTHTNSKTATMCSMICAQDDVSAGVQTFSAVC